MRVTSAIVALTCIYAATGCRADVQSGRAQGSASLTVLTNDRYRSTVSARLAGNAHRLWAVVEGIPHGTAAKHDTSVYEWTREAGWRSLPRPAASTGSGYRVDIAHWRERPCIKFTEPKMQTEVIRCFGRRGWVQVPRNGALAGGDRLVEMVAYDGRLVVLTATTGGLRVVAFENGTWRAMGGLFRARRGSLGTEIRDGKRRPTLGIIRARRGGPGGSIERLAYVLRRGRWIAKQPLRGIASGPSVSGPLVLGSRTFLAHTEVRGTVWPFGVSSLRGTAWTRVGGRPLSRSPGASQGVLDYANGSPWALWQDNVHTPTGFDTTITLVRLTPRGPSTTQQLWQGLSNGPGSLQVLDGAGGSWVVYMPARPTGRGERQVVVAPLPGAASG